MEEIPASMQTVSKQEYENEFVFGEKKISWKRLEEKKKPLGWWKPSLEQFVNVTSRKVWKMEGIFQSLGSLSK